MPAGLFAGPEGLPEGEAYIAVPWSLVLGEHAVSQHRPKLGKVLTQLKAELGADPKSVLLLLLVHERYCSPDDSPW